MDIVYCANCACLVEESGDDLLNWYEDLILQYIQEGVIKTFPTKKQKQDLDHLERIGALVTTEAGEKSLKVKPLGVTLAQDNNESFYLVCFSNCVKFET